MSNNPAWCVLGRGSDTDAHIVSSISTRVQPGIKCSSLLLLICLLFSCPDTAVRVPGPLAGAVLILHPFLADELRHL